MEMIRFMKRLTRRNEDGVGKLSTASFSEMVVIFVFISYFCPRNCSLDTTNIHLFISIFVFKVSTLLPEYASVSYDVRT